MDRKLSTILYEKEKLSKNISALDATIAEYIQKLIEENECLKAENESLKNNLFHSRGTPISTSQTVSSHCHYDISKSGDNISDNCLSSTFSSNSKDLLIKKKCVTAKINAMNELCSGMFQRLKSVALVIKDVLKDEDSEIIGDLVSCVDAAKYEISSSLHEVSILLGQDVEIQRDDADNCKDVNDHIGSLKDLSLSDSILITLKDNPNQELKKKYDELEKERDYYKELCENNASIDSANASNSGSLCDVSEDSRSEHGKENLRINYDQSYLLLHQVIRLVDNIINYCRKKADEVDVTLRNPLKNIEDVSKKAAKKLQQYDCLVTQTKSEDYYGNFVNKSSNNHHSPTNISNKIKGTHDNKKNSEESGFTKEIKIKLMKELKGIRETMVYVSEATTEMFAHCQFKNKPISEDKKILK
uniref:GRIP domain-containing protein n=1 Tax=Strongyloides stercoralis TaxID=6248 RepID=A0A0K0DYE9_STRER